MTWVDRFGVFVSKSCENAIIKKRVEDKNGVIFGEGREVKAITIVFSTIITHHVSHIPKHSIPHPLFLFHIQRTNYSPPSSNAFHPSYFLANTPISLPSIYIKTNNHS